MTFFQPQVLWFFLLLPAFLANSAVKMGIEDRLQAI